MMETVDIVDLIVGELMLFAVVGLMIGGVDDLMVDLCFIVGRLFGGRSPALSIDTLPTPTRPGRIVVFVAAWDEQAVIGAMLSSALARFDHADFRIYCGCYPNDPGTIAAVRAVAAGDPRLRMVVGLRDGPTTKADCLNGLWRALLADEAREGFRAKAVVLHDAEDMVHCSWSKILANN